MDGSGSAPPVGGSPTGLRPAACGLRPAACGLRPVPTGLRPVAVPGAIPAVTSGPAEELRVTPVVWPVGKWPEGMAHDGNFLWVAESGQRTLAQINPSSGAIIERVSSGRLPVGMATNSATGDVFAEVATDKTVVRFSRAAKGGKFGSLSDYPQDITADNTAVWVLMWIDGTNNQGRIVRFDQRSGASSKSDLIGDAVSNIGISGARLWVNQATHEMTRLNLFDPGTLQIQSATSLNGYFPALSVTDHSVVMGGGEWDVQGTLVRVDPVTMQETARKQLGDEFIYQVATDGKFLVAAGTGGTLWILSPLDLTLLRTIRLDWKPFSPASLLIDEDVLYVSTHEGSGEEGSILVIQGWAPTVGQPGFTIP